MRKPGRMPKDAMGLRRLGLFPSTDGYYVNFDFSSWDNPKQIRALIKWLEKCAEFMEQEEKKND